MNFKFLITIIILFFASLIINAQDNSCSFVYNWVDKTLGGENLSINNGKIHTNYDLTLNNENRYLESINFVKGELNYENQNYYNLNLKYDIYNDELILNPSNESEYIKINLIKDNIAFFSLFGKKFVQIKDIQFNGFYQEIQTGKNGVFFIKHLKEKKEILNDNKVYSKYFYKNEYLIFHENKYLKINSKKDLIKIYSNNKSQINDFYESKGNLKKENELKFMENLFRYINNF